MSSTSPVNVPVPLFRTVTTYGDQVPARGTRFQRRVSCSVSPVEASARTGTTCPPSRRIPRATAPTPPTPAASRPPHADTARISGETQTRRDGSRLGSRRAELGGRRQQRHLEHEAAAHAQLAPLQVDVAA